MNTYLVTGGAGHIGSTLVDALIARGDSVVVVDSLLTGKRENVNPSATFIGAPSGSFFHITGLLKAHYPLAGIFHLASSVGVHDVLENPAYAVYNIINPAYEVCEWRKHMHHNKIPMVLASSSEVYGTSGAAMSETATLSILPGPRWSYAAAKLATESMASDLMVARIFNTIGPRQRSAGGAVVATFVDRALKGLPLEVHGSCARSFACVHDTVSGLIALMDAKTPGIYNVGAENHISIYELAQKINEITGNTAGIHTHGTVEDIYDRRPNLVKLRALGWAQEWDLDRTLRWIVAEKVAAAVPQVLTASVL